jgi:hypothetical protein
MAVAQSDRGIRTTNDQAARTAETHRPPWAPWWLYLLLIIGANYLVRAMLPDDVSAAPRVVIALAVAAIVFATITIAYRSIARR